MSRWTRIDEGISLFIFGLAKKVLLADGISALWYDVIGHDVNGVWEAGVGLSNASTPLVWLGIISYAPADLLRFFRLFYDGHRHGQNAGLWISRTTSICLTFRAVSLNFGGAGTSHCPAGSRECIYPLGGNRKGLTRQLFNIFVVWFPTGFWHGANWNFIFWGLYYCGC